MVKEVKERKRPPIEPNFDPADVPGVNDWLRLQQVLGWLDAIVDDAPEAPHSTGLLLLTQEASDLPRSGLSRLGAAMRTIETAGYIPAGYEWASGLCDVLPGLRDLGNTREERIAKLRPLLLNLPAYRWITSRDEYRAMLQMMRDKADEIPGFADGFADFKLILLVADPIRTYHSFMQAKTLASFPRVPEVEDALKAAECVKRFFDRNAGLWMGQRVSWDAPFYADALVQELAAFVRDYKSQPDDGARELQMEMRDRLIVGMAKTFGVESTRPAIVLRALHFIGDSTTDDAAIRKVKRSLGIAAPERPPAPAPMPPVLPIWPRQGT